MGEFTTGRVEWLIRAEANKSTSQAVQSRTVLNLILVFALRPRPGEPIRIFQGRTVTVRCGDIIEVLLGTAMPTGEVQALSPREIMDGPDGMIASFSGTVVQRKGTGAIRQDHSKTDASMVTHRPRPSPSVAEP